MFIKVLCCILIFACYVILCIQIRLEDKFYYGAIYEAEKLRYERACKGEAMSNFNNKDNALTKEEAIEILKDEKYLIWETKEEEAYCLKANEAFDMAIKAMKEEPKSKVIAQINVDADEIVKLIEQKCNWKQPKGHWIVKHIETTPKFVETLFYCSECGEGQIYGMPNFCPNCGADMGRKDND